MDPILIAAREERKRQEKIIAEATAQIEEIERFLRTYSALQMKVAGLSGLAVHASAGQVVPEISQASTIKDRIIAECRAILADGKPRHTRELRSMLLERGVELNGKDQLLQVSAVLSREKSTFAASRSIGWTLRGVPTNGEGPGAQTPEPSNSRQMPLTSAVPQQPQP